MDRFTSVDFVDEIEDSFGKYKHGMRSAILKGLQGISGVKLRDLYKEVLNSYSQAAPPKWAVIKETIRELRISVTNSDEVIFYRCDVCGCNYPLISRGCPKCHKLMPLTVIIANRYPEDFEPSKRDCFVCKHYGKGAVGPVCQHWGTDHKPDRDICRDCLCKKCCHEETIRRYDQDQYRKMILDHDLEDRELKKDTIVKEIKE